MKTSLATPEHAQTAEIKCDCPHCGQGVSSDPSYCGQQVQCPNCKEIFIVPPLAQQHQPSTCLPKPAVSIYAGFWRRFAAAVIDAVILLGLGTVGGGLWGFILVAVMNAASFDLDTMGMVCYGSGYAITIILNWLYFTLFEASARQATPGKMILRIVVTDLNGERVSFGRANGRYWGKILSALSILIGYLMVAFTDKQQALHDMMAGCLVVKKRVAEAGADRPFRSS